MRDVMCDTCCMAYPDHLAWPPREDDLIKAEQIHRQHDGAHWAGWYGYQTDGVCTVYSAEGVW